MSHFSESIVEEAAIDWFGELGYSYLPGPEIAPDGQSPERTGFDSVVLQDRLYDALVRINPEIPSESIEEAVRIIVRTDSPNILLNNRKFHRFITDGLDVEIYEPSPQTLLPKGEGIYTLPSPLGRRAGDEGFRRYVKVKIFDFETPELNDWLVVNQFTMVENHVNRRPDLVVLVNGLPLGVIELKNAADESADLKAAYNQLQTYKAQIPSLFTHNEVLLISDGADARVGSLSADFERFSPWRTVDGESVSPFGMPMLETVIKGVFEPRIFLDLIRHFTVFEDDGGKIIKKLADYHQYHAVNKAVECTINALKTARPSSPALLPEGEGIHYRGGGQYAGLTSRARDLRAKQTPAEEMFWGLVRNRQFMNLKFRRQHQIGDYVTDFCCPEEKLIVEFDGSGHDTPEQQKHDQKRDRYLTSLGFTVLRFKNDILLNSPETIFETIQNSLPSTSGRAGRTDSQQCHHRLDGQGERQGNDPGNGSPDSPQIRLSTRPAGKSHPDHSATGRAALR